MSRPVVAVADDDDELLDALGLALREAGFDVIAAPSGIQLMSQIENRRPSAFVLDVLMSWIDGVDLCRALRRNPRWSQVPIVMISGRGATGDIQRGIDAGADDYFPKPLDVGRLIGRLRDLVQPAGADA